MNNIINFSHKGYLKFKNINLNNGLFLLEVFIKDKKDMSGEFLTYDTTFLYPSGEYDTYKLANGKFLVLLFIDYTSGMLMTTIRRYTPQKYKYYMDSRGRKFSVVFV